MSENQLLLAASGAISLALLSTAAGGADGSPLDSSAAERSDGDAPRTAVDH
ncbi:hypothetical protein ACFWHR_08975 [Leucobacter sp. NPDC058333]|uniref:hypothetical protein n=1 Tax=Leucobacter sp. NPDC058333 TaxID=3346450 RepID=UPI0036683074